MNMLELKRAAAVRQPNHSLLIYGPPKGGKSRLVATAAKIPEIKRIYWFDIENGSDTLMNMGLTDEELTKIIIIKVSNTRAEPIAVETMLKAFTAKKPVSICEMHGRVDCVACAKAGLPSVSFGLMDCTHNDLIVVDSGSELGDSALAAACLGRPEMFKPGFDEYGQAGNWLAQICSVVQQAANTNFVVITHEIALEDDEKKDRMFPLMGTKNFSMRCAKYFGTVVYVHKKMNKHVAGSSSVYRGDLLTGSRLGIELEKSGDPSMHDILVKSGIIKPGSTSEPTTNLPATSLGTKDPIVATVDDMVAEIPKQLSLKERLAATKK